MFHFPVFRLFVEKMPLSVMVNHVPAIIVSKVIGIFNSKSTFNDIIDSHEPTNESKNIIITTNNKPFAWSVIFHHYLSIQLTSL